MTKALRVGTRFSEGRDDGDLVIPIEAVTKTFAIIGIRDSGKSCLGTVMAEEYCKLSIPWIALDPVSNWWGLRSRPDGSPGGFPVVVFGGERGDLPIDKNSGAKIAEAVTSENVFAVIDLKLFSKTLWRTVVRDLARTLMELQPKVPRMLFFEESQEFIPQRPNHQLGEECKEICERLVTLGGNWGYGATLLGQRPASIDKSALNQCETVFIFRTQGAHDRKALKEWITEKQVDQVGEDALRDLAFLKTRNAWCWSPHFLQTFTLFTVRERETLHPRDARRRGISPGQVEMAPVDEFVARVRKQLTKVQATVHADFKNPKTVEGLGNAARAVHKNLVDLERQVLSPVPTPAVAEISAEEAELTKLRQRITELEQQLGEERVARINADRRVDFVRQFFKPQFDTMQQLFKEIAPAGNGSAVTVDRTIFEPWLAKAGQKGCRRMLEILIERGELTRNQLGTLAGIPHTGSTFRTYLSWLRSNGLIETKGDVVRLRPV